MVASHREKYLRFNDCECENCGSDDSVHIHHRDGDATNDHLDNLISLCASCHRKVHAGSRETELLARLAIEADQPDAQFDPANFDDVPQNATVTVKETYPGCKYYYWQWRDGDDIRSECIGSCDEYPTGMAAKSQAALTEF